jgi:hypothetical protein
MYLTRRHWLGCFGVQGLNSRRNKSRKGGIKRQIKI